MNQKEKKVEFIWIIQYFDVKYYFKCDFRNHSYSLALCVERKRIKYQYEGDKFEYGFHAVESKKIEKMEIWKVINVATIQRNVSEFPSHYKSMVWIGDREAVYEPSGTKEVSPILEGNQTSDFDSGSERDTSSDEDY